MAWLTRSTSAGGAKTPVGLSAVGAPPLTSSSHVPAKRSTTLVPPYSRYSSAPSTSTQNSRERAGSATTRMWVTATSPPSGPPGCCVVITRGPSCADGSAALEGHGTLQRGGPQVRLDLGGAAEPGGVDTR